jgi:hypothetical protein
VEHGCESVGVSDAPDDTGFISGVDSHLIATGFVIDVDLSYIEPEFMPEYEAALGMSVRRTQLMIDQFLS